MEIQTLIEEKGGVFVNTFIENKRNYVVFECDKGHLNQKRVDTMIGKGKTSSTWCAECTKNTIEDAHSLAREKEFTFLSDTYINANSHYNWQCSQGHIWRAKYGNIYSSKGCPQCLRISYETIVQLAESKGGKCLTKEEDFENTRKTKIKWQCGEGHKWITTYNSVNQGRWCGKCNDTIFERTSRCILEYIYKKKFIKKRPQWLTNSQGGRMEIDGYCEELKLGFEFNGVQHYKRIPYWHKTQKQFEDQQARDLEKYQLCETNNIVLIVIPYIVKYEDLYNYILERCPNPPEDTPETIDYSVLEVESLNNSKLRDISNYVKEKFEGDLLSNIYVNNTTRLDFRCKEGHCFKQTWGIIISGIFCKKCTYEVIRLDMEKTVRHFAVSKNLRVLDRYTTAKKKIRWECVSCSHIVSRSWDGMRKSKGFHCENTFGS